MNLLSIDDEKQRAGLMARAALYYNPIPLDGEGFFVCTPLAQPYHNQFSVAFWEMLLMLQ